ncbi:MAG: class I SAM-dependent methyltransferase [Methanoregulaceae archaeon]|nr:class I SAM-dependent methyltransferase [Methanoregulaceae archaeon]
MYRIIDWNELWKAIHVNSPERTRKDRDPASIWDKRAGAYHRVTRNEHDATERDLSFIALRPEDTVLDMGAGTGRLAVPIAGRVARVTALDPSGGMLGILRERMKQEGCSNYSCVQMRWEDVEIGRDIEPHDVVIAAFSLGFFDLGAALARLDKASRRSVYLFWHAGEWRGEEEMKLYKVVFGEEGAMQKGYPDYIYPLNILHDTGIFASLRIYPALWESSYASVDEAVQNWVTMHHPEPGDLSPITDFFSRVLRPDSTGRLVHSGERLTAVIWWTKE